MWSLGRSQNLSTLTVTSDGLEEELLAKLTERLQDKFYLVRVMSAKGLAPLHDPSDPSDPVLQSLLQLLSNDPARCVVLFLRLTFLGK